jgi:hypothetical protein
LIQICSNYEFLCFMKFAPVNMEFCFFTTVVDLFLLIWSADVATFYQRMLFQ